MSHRFWMFTAYQFQWKDILFIHFGSRGRSLHENSATSKVIGEETIQFRSHDGCITTFQDVHHVSKSRYNLISLGALHSEGFCFSSKGDLMKVFKEAHAMFQAERVGNVYMLRNSEVTVGGL